LWSKSFDRINRQLAILEQITFGGSITNYYQTNWGEDIVFNVDSYRQDDETQGWTEREVTNRLADFKPIGSYSTNPDELPYLFLIADSEQAFSWDTLQYDVTKTQPIRLCLLSGVKKSILFAFALSPIINLKPNLVKQ
jgi:hypothetical protein